MFEIWRELVRVLAELAWCRAIFICQNRTPAAASLRAAVLAELQQVLKLNYQGKLNF